MATVSIRPDAADDGFYRYKMALLMTKIEGKGNGIKTVIPNMSEIAKSLNRPATYPTKFFGCELGAQTVFDEAADRYIVNGAHDATRLRELLYTFIEKFVLCAYCRNPETNLVITKDDSILRDCKACGQRRPVDMKHKLCTFILRNPPPKSEKKRTTAKATTTSTSKKNGKTHNGKGDSDQTEEDGDLLIPGQDDIAVPEIDISRPADQENWSVDTSKEAVAARVSELAAGVQNNLVIDPTGEKAAANGNATNGHAIDDEEDEGPVNALAKWVSEHKSASDVEIYKYIHELGIAKSSRAVQAIVLGLFDENVLQTLKSHEALFQKLVTSEKHQKALLGGLEIFVGEKEPSLMSLTPKILMILYQADILEDEVVQHWGTHTSKKYVDKDVSKKVRRSAAPFLKWLEEADEDEDSDDSE